MPTILEFADRESLLRAATAMAAATLATALAGRERAVLMASGGSTPGPVYSALAHAPLDWERLVVGLADERWVEPEDPGSNAGLIRATLMQGRAVRARFLPMYHAGISPPAAIAAIEADYAAPAGAIDLLILGMGADGHTLSWFPGADGLPAIMDPDAARSVGAIRALPSPATGPWLDRITLSARAVRQASRALLLITGQDKRAVFDAPDRNLPVHALDGLLGDRLCVFWAP